MLNRPITFPEFEVQTEYTIQSPSETTRGTLMILQDSEFVYDDFVDSHFGYRSDYKGIGVYIFRSYYTKKWHVMTLQGNGISIVLSSPTQLTSSMKPENSCEFQMTTGQKFGIRLQIQGGLITTYVEDSADVSFRKCSSA